MTVDRPTHPFRITHQLVNPILQLLLRSRVGGRVGRSLAVLSYQGRRTGKQHELVVQYARDGAHVWIIPGQPEHKTWWRNFRDPRDVEVRLAGEEFHGTAVVLDGTEYPDELRRGVVVYLDRFPRAAKGLGVSLSPLSAHEMDSANEVRTLVIVRVDLDKTP